MWLVHTAQNKIWWEITSLTSIQIQNIFGNNRAVILITLRSQESVNL